MESTSLPLVVLLRFATTSELLSWIFSRLAGTPLFNSEYLTNFWSRYGTVIRNTILNACASITLFIPFSCLKKS